MHYIQCLTFVEGDFQRLLPTVKYWEFASFKQVKYYYNKTDAKSKHCVQARVDS